MNRDADITYLLSESMETRQKARKVAAIALIAAIKNRRALDDERGGAHAEGEWIDLASLPRQATRSAILISRLAAQKR